ncbi:MAG: 16S rRNA (cytidine(1402)-2'-O)-methyltransferase [Neisseriaceae bacterium]|nr:16S rRNA (cytidine(1402)-2'-O)-methyltransferase [Neisseriaceae bacterium]
MQTHYSQAQATIQTQTLYVLATPIGNLSDITLRALAVLERADLICAEDTRVTGQLLAAYGIKSKLISVREHNERQMVDKVAEALANDQVVVQVSDAGTPAICDPGAKLAQAIRAKGYKVSPIVGPSAVIAALSVAGMTSANFYFAGFLPPKTKERQTLLQKWQETPYTVIMYETPHRIEATLADMLEVLGPDRRLVMAREITKTFETFIDGSVAEVLAAVKADRNQTRGEMVLILDAAPAVTQSALSEATEHVMKVLAAQLPTKQAAELGSKITNENKKVLYDYALSLKKD